MKSDCIEKQTDFQLRNRLKTISFLTILVFPLFLVACQSLQQEEALQQKGPILYSFDRAPTKINIECSSIQNENGATQNESEPPQLGSKIQLNIKRYRSIIWDVLITCDQKYLVSAGDDKTIRIWDRATGKEIRTILEQTGLGLEGKIYAIALTPDNQTLAVGGILGKRDGKKVGNILLYDFPSGRLRWTLKSHTNTVHDLHFSQDGRFLVSGSADKTVKIWIQREFRYPLYKTFSHHTRSVYGVRVFQQENDIRVVSASWDGTVNFYSLKGGLLKAYDRGSRAHYLALNQQYIAVSGRDKQIQIFDYDLNLLHTITSDTINPPGLSFSPDGQWLLVGTNVRPHNRNSYDTGTWQQSP